MDTDIIERAKRKDPKALAEIYERYRPRMMGTCMKIIREDKDMASDLVHDAFILAFVSLDKLRDNERLGEWLTTIVRNVALKYMAQKERMRVEPLSAIGGIDSSSSPDVFVNSRDILRLVDQLPEGYAKIFRLSVIEGFTHKEIADMLGIEPHSSSSQLSRAKRLLRRMMQYRKLAVALLLAGLVPLAFFLSHHDEQEVYKAIKTKKEKAKRITHIQPPNNVDTKPYNHTADSGIDIVRPKDTIISIPITEEERLTMETVEDSVRIIRKDSIMMPEEYHQANEDKTKSRKWPFLSVRSFGPTLAQNVYKILSTDNITSAEGETTEVQHDKPITLGLSLTKPLNDRWSIETGLQYSLLNSHFTQKSSSHTTASHQTVHYLGWPLKLSYCIVGYKQLSAYQSAGITLHIPVYGKMETDGMAYSVSPSVQWAANISLGLQYELTSNMNIFIEPTVNWFIPSGSNTHTIWTERPIMVTSPFGIRFTW